MRHAFQAAALLLASLLALAPLAQAAPACRMLGSPGHCSSCPMPSDSNPGMNSSAPCCRISAAKPSAPGLWQPAVIYAPAPPAARSVTAAISFAPVPQSSADDPSPSGISSPQALLCTFLI